MSSITRLSDLSTLKQRHRTIWELGDYPQVSDRLIPRLGEALVAALSIGAGESVLDVAAGAGNAALPAARAGARVTALDLSDTLLAECARRAEADRLDVHCVAGDAEQLWFGDGAFDVVMSCVGVMFAPDQSAAAAHLLRVCRPGGRVGVISWTADGFVGRLLATVRPYLPPPPVGSRPPTTWGDPDQVRDLLGSGVSDVEARVGRVRVDGFSSPAEFRSYFSSGYGPLVAAFQGLSDTPERRVALEAALDDLAGAAMIDGAMEWEYLMVTANRRAASH